LKSLLKVVAIFLAILYPGLIYITLSYFNASPKVLSFMLVSVAVVYFLAHTDDAGGEPLRKIQFWGMLAAATILAALTFFTENTGFVKFYPVSINLLLLSSFTITLYRPPSMIFRFALMQDKVIKESDEKEYIEIYCRKVTVIWIFFFIFNGIMALITALFFSHFVWALYNGLISYIFIGIIFVTEFVVRKFKVKR
jgi:uncharacterized membrane protein